MSAETPLYGTILNVLGILGEDSSMEAEQKLEPQTPLSELPKMKAISGYIMGELPRPNILDSAGVFLSVKLGEQLSRLLENVDTLSNSELSSDEEKSVFI